ncbi:MAG TPA: hypothetical protein DCE23_05320 [Firmicutes bacterium]|nr:hypothetical protein [Bacillota bacterium]
MNTREEISKFSKLRPLSIGTFGYGSAVFKQANVNGNCESPAIDIIFVVEDLKIWHQKNMYINPSDYSLIGRLHLNYSSNTRLKGRNRITYLSNIKEANRTFKYGVIEVEDFIRSLETWENIFVAGRFQKPILKVSTTEEIDKAINYNRHCALLIASILSAEKTTIYSLYNILCGLSYYGDARMSFAENPHKVKNIVEGNFKELLKIYNLQENFLIIDSNGNITINHQILLQHITDLPVSLLAYLSEQNIDFRDIDDLRIGIYSFLHERNKQESIAQITEGIKSNGIINSIPYIASKIKKHFR